MRQRGELNWASQLQQSSGQQISSTVDKGQYWLDKIRKAFST